MANGSYSVYVIKERDSSGVGDLSANTRLSDSESRFLTVRSVNYVRIKKKTNFRRGLSKFYLWLSIEIAIVDKKF